MRTTLSVVLLSLVTACGGKSSPRPSSTGPAPAALRPTGEPAGGGDRVGRADDGYGGSGYGGSGYGGDGYGGLGWDEDAGWNDDAWAGPPPAPAGPQVAGRWVSACLPGAVRGESTRLTYDFTDSTWTQTIDGFRDAACARHQVAVQSHGAYALGAASTAVAGAWEVQLVVAGRELIVDDARAARTYARHCKLGKLAAGKSADLAGGCPGWKLQPLARCATDFDLLALVDDELQLGVRPADNDLCTPGRRPTALQPALKLSFTAPTVGVATCDALLQAQLAMLRCPKLPAEVRATLRSAIAQTAHAMVDAAKIKEAAATLSTGCAQAEQAMASTLTSLGCSP